MKAGKVRQGLAVRRLSDGKQAIIVSETIRHANCGSAYVNVADIDKNQNRDNWFLGDIEIADELSQGGKLNRDLYTVVTIEHCFDDVPYLDDFKTNSKSVAFESLGLNDK